MSVLPLGSIRFHIPVSIPWRGLWTQQRGFSLLETIAAVFIAGTVVTATVVAIGTSARIAARQEESVRLVQLVRAQIETIQQSPYEDNPADYPIVSGIPDGFTVSSTSTDPGISYTYPPPLATSTLTNLVQEIEVTAVGDFSEMSMTFYRVRLP